MQTRRCGEGLKTPYHSHLIWSVVTQENSVHLLSDATISNQNNVVTHSFLARIYRLRGHHPFPSPACLPNARSPDALRLRRRPEIYERRRSRETSRATRPRRWRPRQGPCEGFVTDVHLSRAGND